MTILIANLSVTEMSGLYSILQGCVTKESRKSEPVEILQSRQVKTIKRVANEMQVPRHLPPC